MTIKEELKEVIASVLYTHVTDHYKLSEKIADSIIMNFTIGPDYLFKEQ